MKLLESLSNPWLITAEYMESMAETVRSHMLGPKLNLSSIEEKINTFSTSQEDRDFEVVNGRAIIPLYGMIVKKPSAFERIFYGARGLEKFEDMFDQALADESIKEIIIDVNSPGGAVPGVQNMAAKIFKSRGKKQITAFVSEMMASAATWIGTAADRVIIGEGTTKTGSIGVYTTHVSWKDYEKRVGLQTTLIKAGKYKVSQHPDNKLNKDDKEYIQGQVDYIYDLFTKDVARNRGVGQETVMESMADGKIFIGQQGIEAGLVDGFSSIERLTENSNDFDKNIRIESPVTPGVEIPEQQPEKIENPGADEPEQEKPQEATKMDLEELLANDPKGQDKINALVDARIKEKEDAFNAETKELKEFAAPYTSNENYSKKINEMAAKVPTREVTKDALLNAVIIHDEVKEAMKSEAAADESGKIPDTPAEQQKATDISKIENQGDMAAAVAEVKKLRG
jgi:signal peptide peptidase SppA